ncbi:MAG: TVP38/TMEM64 family protein [Pseudomonadota bacterium]
MVLVAVIVSGIVATPFVMDALLAEEGDPIHARLEAMTDALGAWGPAGIVALMVLHSFVPFPAEIVALYAGAAYGTVLGTLWVWIGAMLGALLSFGLARWLGRRAVERLLPKAQRTRLDRWVARQGALTLLVSRFIPIIAFNLINYAAGLTKIRLFTFFWTTAVGILPLTTLMVHLGAQMATLSWPMLAAVSLGGIATAVGTHALAKRRGWLERRP